MNSLSYSSIRTTRSIVSGKQIVTKNFYKILHSQPSVPNSIHLSHSHYSKHKIYTTSLSKCSSETSSQHLFYPFLLWHRPAASESTDSSMHLTHLSHVSLTPTSTLMIRLYKPVEDRELLVFLDRGLVVVNLATPSSSANALQPLLIPTRPVLTLSY